MRRGIQRLKIKNLDPDHVLWDLDRRPEDGLTCGLFLEAFDWKQSNKMHTGVFSSESRSSIASARESKPRIDAALNEALAKNPHGWDAIRYMSRYRLEMEVEREKPKYDPATLIDIIEPKDVRLLSAREKFMIRNMQPPTNNKFHPPKKGEKPWADRLSTPGWKNELDEDPEVVALKLEHHKSLELRRSLQSTAKPQSLKLDLSGLSSPHLPASITFSSGSNTTVRVIKPQHKMTDGFAFSEDGDHVRRLMREHEAIVSARRPVISAVTADHLWIKQSALLAAVRRKEEESAREKERYDLDGRCYPTARGAESANVSMAEGAGKDVEASLDAAMKSGDHAELSAIMKRRQNESSNQSANRDPYDHASSANIAYMQIQLVNASSSSLPNPNNDPALQVCHFFPPSPPNITYKWGHSNLQDRARGGVTAAHQSRSDHCNSDL